MPSAVYGDYKTQNVPKVNNSTFSNIIVVVDDDECDQILIHTLAKRAGVKEEFKFFDHGENFLNFLESSKERIKPKLIIIDLNMPRMGGVELMKKLKSNRLLSLTPVFVLSASLDPALEEELMGLGACGCCSKASSFTDIQSMLTFNLR
jgi:CheY-like chemotaxis protein